MVGRTFQRFRRAFCSLSNTELEVGSEDGSFWNNN